jgi:hypothetical protein
MDMTPDLQILLTELVNFYYFVKAVLKVNVSQEPATGPVIKLGENYETTDTWFGLRTRGGCVGWGGNG